MPPEQRSEIRHELTAEQQARIEELRQHGYSVVMQVVGQPPTPTSRPGAYELRVEHSGCMLGSRMMDIDASTDKVLTAADALLEETCS